MGPANRIKAGLLFVSVFLFSQDSSVMANEFLKHKWRLWFRIFDTNHTGVFSTEDETGHEERYVNLNDLELARKKEVIEASKEMMKEHYFRGISGPLTEQAFVDMNDKEFTEDKNKFKERMSKLFDTVFGKDLLDLDKEGSVTEESFVNSFRAAGHTNTELLAEFFRAYVPVNCKVSNKVLVESWVHFSTCEDDSSPDIVRKYLEAGI